MLPNSVLQRAFHLISCIHPSRAVALCVLLDACSRISAIRNLQRRRHGYKVQTPEDSLIQFSVYAASERWEKDQESESPTLEPTFKPTLDDRIVRYIKTLAWKSMDWPSTYAATGVGCLVFRYQPHEVGVLSEEVFKGDNIRRVKSTMTKFLKERFPGSNGFADANGDLPYEIPTNHQRILIESSLSHFAPWACCASAQTMPFSSLLETHFSRSSEKSEWERLHVLFHAPCGGFSRLVNEYNANFKRGNIMRLEDPEKKLGSPKFGDWSNGPSEDDGNQGPSNPLNRFEVSPLAPEEIALIKHALEQNERRRDKYRAGTLRVLVDGREKGTFNPNSAFKPFSIPSSASYIEIFGEDEEGELLLALIPLALQGIVCDTFDQQVSLSGGQRIRVSIKPVPELELTPGQDSEPFMFSISLGYSDLSRLALPKPAAICGAELSQTVSGQYRILGILGYGAHSTVYKVEDLTRKQPYALKLFHFGENDLQVCQFKNEVAKLARIDHPGVVRIYDFKTLSETEPYLVEEYVPGVSLREELDPQGLDLNRIAELSRQITEALAAAHRMGVLHRDLKPENILLHKVDNYEQVKVCDFGIAKGLAEDLSADCNVILFYNQENFGHSYWDTECNRGKDSQNSKSIIFGTPVYMAPELMMGYPASIQTDLYAFGVMLYEMMTGQAPFIAHSYSDLFHLKCTAMNSKPRDLRPALPEMAQDVILRALEKDPKDRYNSVQEFGDALEKALTYSKEALQLVSKLKEQPRTLQTPDSGVFRKHLEGWLKDLLDAIGSGRKTVADLIEHPRFRNTLMMICRSQARTSDLNDEDLCQEVFIRLWKSDYVLTKTNWRDEGHFLGWIRAFTHNICLDNERRNRIKTVIPTESENHFEANLVGRVFLKEFEDFIRVFPVPHQNAAMLWMAGLTYREIAERLNADRVECSHVTVRAWIAEILEEFKIKCT